MCLCIWVCHTLLLTQVALVNLDPANDGLPYSPAVDVGDLVDLDAVMDQLHLGPNGGERKKGGGQCAVFLCIYAVVHGAAIGLQV